MWVGAGAVEGSRIRKERLDLTETTRPGMYYLASDTIPSIARIYLTTTPSRPY